MLRIHYAVFSVYRIGLTIACNFTFGELERWNWGFFSMERLFPVRTCRLELDGE